MIRIRFHGRGGHGTKTASRIVGTAAFLGGYVAQDSPVYGAERRGAAVVAFTRIATEPILERGEIEQPDLIVVADETLLEVSAANILAHQDAASAIFLNTPNAASLIQKYRLSVPVVALDLTELARTTLGMAGALSAGLAAAAARLCGIITDGQLEEAVRTELAELQLPKTAIDKNVELARQVFARLEPVELRAGTVRGGVELVDVRYDPPLASAPSVLQPGNAVARQTGSWRVERPVVDPDICTRCGLCFVRCPDGAIALDEDGFPVIDYDHCKGCMICHQICPLHAIEVEKETRAW